MKFRGPDFSGPRFSDQDGGCAFHHSAEL